MLKKLKIPIWLDDCLFVRIGDMNSQENHRKYLLTLNLYQALMGSLIDKIIV